ncbi:integrin alpha-9-like isoform X1 [Lethenteron reissneri]|uniref:integrin alpha-9-like isoform X1 n=1 Tax=Lethenteron reissneri TaxID=7753 RepID=UPI002AB6D971|nr:integrin alpha-9-like isoform X1 [Lethenteron reissneri]
MVTTTTTTTRWCRMMTKTMSTSLHASSFAARQTKRGIAASGRDHDTTSSSSSHSSSSSSSSSTSSTLAAPLLLLLAVVVLVAVAPGVVSGYSLDADRALLYFRPNSSFFGYSVLPHVYQHERWVLVGAPQSRSPLYPNTKRPGSLFRCPVRRNPTCSCSEVPLDMTQQNQTCGKYCRADLEDQWLGVSLKRQPGSDGKILVCAHRWKNVHYRKTIYPYGVCLLIPASLVARQGTKQLRPCHKNKHRNYGEEHGSCQAGMSAAITQDAVVMGAPGSFYWTGTVVVWNATENRLHYHAEPWHVGPGSYLGYSVETGNFVTPGSTEIAGGAPQHSSVGKVFLFKVDNGKLIPFFEASGKKLGSYFGASLCVGDVNGDSLSDLLVGAPFHSDVRDEGRVFLFLSRGGGAMLEMPTPLQGDNAYNARFGEAMVNLGDLDHDHYPEFAIGAPYEDDNGGAVYVYHGSAHGIAAKYSQRISGRGIHPSLRMFGQSLAGGLDLDDNGFADLTVGAYGSNAAVLIRARPVVDVSASVVLPRGINVTGPGCGRGGRGAHCFPASVCFSYSGPGLAHSLDMRYELIADSVKQHSGLPVRLSLESAEGASSVPGSVRLAIHEQRCLQHVAYVKGKVNDVVAPLVFEVRYSLAHGETAEDEPSGASRRRRSDSPGGGNNTGSDGAGDGGGGGGGDDDDDDLPALRPVIRWRERHRDSARSATKFERNCHTDVCPADLRVNGTLVLPRPLSDRPYLVVGEVRSLRVNLSLANVGEDAFDPTLHLHFHPRLFLVNAWDTEEEKALSCEVLEGTLLQCSVGFPFLKSHTKREVSVLFDSSQLSGEDDLLEFSAQITSQNIEHNETLGDNHELLSIPLRYEVDTTLHGSVSQTSILYGGDASDREAVALPGQPCHFQWLNFTFQALNLGPSRAPGAFLEVLIPSRLHPEGPHALQLHEVQVSPGGGGGSCSAPALGAECVSPEHSGESVYQLFSFFSKSGRTVLDCASWPEGCVSVRCELGPFAPGETPSVSVKALLNTDILQQESSSVIQFSARAELRVPHSDRVVELSTGAPGTIAVVFEALHDLRPRGFIAVWIIAISLIIGLLILILLIVLLWKLGFFKRNLKEELEMQRARKKSWDWVKMAE